MEQHITPCLWFDAQVEEAAAFYVGVFRGAPGRWAEGSAVGPVTRYDPEVAAVAGRPEGSVMTTEFSLAGQRYLGLNGGPAFRFTEAISLMIECDTQPEIDWFWSRLSLGGQESECGWLKDRYGLSWQVVPTFLGDVMRRGDAKATQRLMKAVLGMRKLDLATLKRAVEAG